MSSGGRTNIGTATTEYQADDQAPTQKRRQRRVYRLARRCNGRRYGRLSHGGASACERRSRVCLFGIFGATMACRRRIAGAEVGVLGHVLGRSRQNVEPATFSHGVAIVGGCAREEISVVASMKTSSLLDNGQLAPQWLQKRPIGKSIGHDARNQFHFNSCYMVTLVTQADLCPFLARGETAVAQRATPAGLLYKKDDTLMPAASRTMEFLA
jgi:hypothetical protein